MRREIATAVLVLLLPLTGEAARAASPSGYTLVGWNNLGMHCMDADFSAFSILPPYNVLQAQLIGPDGKVVAAPGSIRVTYQGVADAKGSINTTSAGKTNFWQYVKALFGADLPVDAGLNGANMPGASNAPQAMKFDAASRGWIADGIPIAPRDDAGRSNSYPLVRLVARDAAGTMLASTDVVLPVSDEMDCRACHASNGSPAARPAAGWVNDPNPQLDYRYNVLALHDDRERQNPTFEAALAQAGYDAQGLYVTAHDKGTPILCARCHASNALPGTGIAGIPQLTHAVHALHAHVTDPTNNQPMDASTNRSACYRCHPGATTKCLRGAMGSAVATDGTMEMQCQNCHGPMSAVGSSARNGWLDQPTCQNCHTGTATSNSGQIRYTSALLADGTRRPAANATFATNSDVPAPGYSLYRASTGHGGLACEACHGATHAEYTSFEDNDNVQSKALQGHAGVISDCAVCHASVPNTTSGGPHGMHPVGQAWVSGHEHAAEGNRAACAACHGSDYRGTVLSYALGDRVLNTEFGTKTFWKGFQISCYACHNGPGSESANPNRAPVASCASQSASATAPSTIPLSATDADRNTLTYRIVKQPRHGTVGLSGAVATYHPEPGYTGPDTFTWAAWDGSVNSNLATESLDVGGTAPQRPAAPSNLTARGGSSGSGSPRRVFVDLAWRDNASNETGFALERCSGSTCTNFAALTTVGANVTTFRDQSVGSRRAYRYRVKARGAAGDSAYSNVAGVTTP